MLACCCHNNVLTKYGMTSSRQATRTKASLTSKYCACCASCCQKGPESSAAAAAAAAEAAAPGLLLPAVKPVLRVPGTMASSPMSPAWPLAQSFTCRQHTATTSVHKHLMPNLCEHRASKAATIQGRHPRLLECLSSTVAIQQASQFWCFPVVWQGKHTPCSITWRNSQPNAPESTYLHIVHLASCCLPRVNRPDLAARPRSFSQSTFCSLHTQQSSVWQMSTSWQAHRLRCLYRLSLSTAECSNSSNTTTAVTCSGVLAGPDFAPLRLGALVPNPFCALHRTVLLVLQTRSILLRYCTDISTEDTCRLLQRSVG